jgi:hypothetical protein
MALYSTPVHFGATNLETREVVRIYHHHCPGHCSRHHCPRHWYRPHHSCRRHHVHSHHQVCFPGRLSVPSLEPRQMLPPQAAGSIAPRLFGTMLRQETHPASSEHSTIPTSTVAEVEEGTNSVPRESKVGTSNIAMIPASLFEKSEHMHAVSLFRFLYFSAVNYFLY